LVFLFSALLLLAIGARQANAWWDGKWQFRKKVGFDTAAGGGNVKDSLSEVPVLVRLHSGNFDFGNAKEDGADIRFVSSDDKAPLKFHIEKFDPKQGIALIWVRVPQLAGGTNQNAVWMYYGNGSAPAAQDPGGTYDTPQAAVFHFAEKDGNPKDATAYGNHASEFKGKLGAPSVIGVGAAFNGAGDRMTVKSAPSLAFAKGFSFSAWVRIGQAQKDAWLFAREEGKQSIVVGINKTQAYCRLAKGGKFYATKPGGKITPQAWHHIAVTADPGGRLVVYLDGREAAAADKLPETLPDPSGDLVIGASAKGDHSFAGELDEVQIAGMQRPAGWAAAAVAGQGADGKMTTYQQEEAGNGKGGGESLTVHLMKVVARTISLDGWIIIGILAFLSALSWYVFINKALVIRRTSKDNRAFSDSLRGLNNPLDLECEEDDFQNSSLYRVYLAGCEDLTTRPNGRGDDLPAAGIPAKAARSLRAALEKASLQESRKMGAGLIVLTMGISGGPFLGLLGTVWGVMNTFASMAEAGEANLTAIAPGVASALACTLAGLVVAIPALFAYSYLTSNIKDLSAEMNLFIDEFLLKVGGEEGDAA
jgi:biopolymer transport protein ExbB